jgi:hypothetical protein
MSTIKPFRMYRCDPPGQAAFECAVVEQVEDFTVRVISTRNGPWQIETEITVAALLSPEQALSDWTVRRIEPREIKASEIEASCLCALS